MRKSFASKGIGWLFAGTLWCVFPTLGGGLPKLWEAKVGAYVDSSPAIDPAGNIYVTVSGNSRFSDIAGGKLVVFSPNGSVKSEYQTRSEIKSSPALGADGTVYFGCRDRRLHAVEANNGAKRWTYLTGGWVDSSPAIGTNGVVYFGSWDGRFYALTTNGIKKWVFATAGPIDSSPAIGADGTIYFGSHDSNFYALDVEGNQKWAFKTQGAIISSPALGKAGLIYFTSVDGRLYAIGEDGREKWHLWTGGTGPSSPVLDAEGNIYVGVNDSMWAVKPDGTRKWSFGYPETQGAAAVAADGTIYFGGTDQGVGLLYAWNADGSAKNYTPVGGGVTGSPAIAENGTVYVAGASSGFQAYKGGAGQANIPWPRFRGDAAQTGRQQSR